MLTLDRKRRGNPVKTQPAERRYAGQLRKIAEHCGTVINGFPPGDHGAAATITQLLDAYAAMLQPWAVQTASNMLMDVALRDERTWKEYAKDLSRGLREEIRRTPTGVVMQQLLSEQVGLIQSIPRDAAERVHRLTLAGIEDSTRASEIAKEIMRSGEVAKSRAVLIARTEVSRTASTLTEARALHIGATHYIWRTSGDSDVRPGHKEMDGKICEWAKPPRVNEGTAQKPNYMHHHPGMVWNCRCYAEPILPDL